MFAMTWRKSVCRAFICMLCGYTKRSTLNVCCFYQQQKRFMTCVIVAKFKIFFKYL